MREGYKSADSKRQNGDLDNLTQALKRGYLMTMVLMSLQINETVRRRYQEGGLLVLIGDITSNNPCESTYAFLKPKLLKYWNTYSVGRTDAYSSHINATR